MKKKFKIKFFFFLKKSLKFQSFSLSNFPRKISLLPPKNIDPGEAEAFDLLKIAKENNLISSVKILLDQLIENNFWLSNQLYNLVLKIS